MKLKSMFVFSFLCLAGFNSKAQLHMIKEICPGENTSYFGPSHLTVVNKLLFYVVTDESHGSELWTSDGTSTGTRMVKDINAGNAGSGIDRIEVVNNKAYFEADDGVHGNELWQSDGTESGTAMVKDVNPGMPDGILQNSLHVVLNELFFAGDDGTGGYQLWKSDGSAQGTVLLLKSVKFRLGYMNALNGNYICYGVDSANGMEIWITDGTISGTKMLKDINPSNKSSSPTYYIPLNGQLLFIANDGIHGEELWTTDGTSNGTYMLKDINKGSGWSNMRNFTFYHSKLYFSASDTSSNISSTDKIWETDGTVSGTKKSFQIDPSTTGKISAMTVAFDYLVISGIGSYYGPELWKSKGTQLSTEYIKSFNTTKFSSHPNYLTVVGSTLYFSAYDAVYGSELWMSDLTDTGTKLVKEINQVSKVAYTVLTEIAGFDNTLFFNGNDGIHGYELWTNVHETGISRHDFQDRIKVYPVPSAGILNVETENVGLGQIKIIDVNGKVLKTFIYLEDEKSVQIDVSDINSGVYIVCLQLKNGNLINKQFIISE